MSINSRCGRTDAAVRAGIAARLAEIQERADQATDGPWFQGREGRPYENTCDVFSKREPEYEGSHDIATYVWSPEDAEFIASARTDVPSLTNAVESVMDYVARCEESGITMQPGDVRRLIAAALGGAS